MFVHLSRALYPFQNTPLVQKPSWAGVVSVCMLARLPVYVYDCRPQMSVFEPWRPARPDSPQHLIGVSWLAAFLVRCAVASRLKQRVRTPIQHHCGGCHGNYGYSITHSSLQSVVPFIVGNRDQTWDTGSVNSVNTIIWNIQYV